MMNNYFLCKCCEFKTGQHGNVPYKTTVELLFVTYRDKDIVFLIVSFANFYFIGHSL